MSTKQRRRERENASHRQRLCGESQRATEALRSAAAIAKGPPCTNASLEAPEVPTRPLSFVFVNPVQPQFAEGAPCGVLLRGLPNELCTETMMKVVLEQAGLKSYYLDCRLEQGEPCGEAFFSLTSQSSAEYAVWHFENCQWGNSPSPIIAHMVEVAYGQLSYEDEMEYACGCEFEGGHNLMDTVLTALLEPSVFDAPSTGSQARVYQDALPLFFPSPQPAMICDIQRPCYPSEGSAEALPVVAQSKSALWEKCSDQVTAEGSTDAGTSEVSDDHDGED